MLKYIKEKIKKTDFYKLIVTISHVAQIIICIVAILGYIYTVKPMYQNQLLNETLLRKELELDSLEKEKKELNKQKMALEHSIDKYKNGKKQLLVEQENLITKNNELNNNIKQMESKLLDIKVQRKAIAQNILFQQFYMKVGNESITYLDFENIDEFTEIVDSMDTIYDLLDEGNANINIKKYLKGSYNVLKDQIEDFNPKLGKNISKNDLEIFKKMIINKIENNKEYLIKMNYHLEDDIKIVIDQYNEEIIKLSLCHEQEIKKINDRLDGGEISESRKQVMLSDIKSIIRNKKREIRNKYYDKLSKIDDKIITPIESIEEIL
ncbi:hypothetical protein [Halocella sp. SP3-1]|uniref:hypothetical protein n=1 Tax=Halocella sp. SP3-1 TaxID=2382161 RepID=UPI000F7F7903|nr:hypothetical protein [Halocella sp. SP3-1]